MPSYYTVVRYVPDPVADERMNVGVIVYGDGHVRSHFIRNWQRARGFGRQDIAFLRDIAEQLKEPQMQLLPGSPNWDEATLNKIVGRWKNSIQFSEPKASLQPTDELLSEISQRFLRESSHAKREARDRRTAASLGLRKVKTVLSNRFGKKTEKLLKRNHFLDGKLDKHEFDIVVANGHPFFAAEALSFEVPDNEELLKDMEAVAWAVDDVRKESPKLPLAIIALPPKNETDTYKRAKRIFKGLNAALVLEGKIDDWAQEMVRAVKL